MNDGIACRPYAVHRNILCAASLYFRNRLVPGGKVSSPSRLVNEAGSARAVTPRHVSFQVDPSAKSLSLEMKFSVFEAFLGLIYDGCAFLDADALEDFRAALVQFELVCLPDPDAPPEISTAKRPKKENAEAEEKQKPPLSLSLDDLSEDKIKRLIRDGAGPKEYFCCICGKKYISRTNTFNHIMFVHRTVRDYACAYCTEWFATPALRSMHVSKFHAAEHVVRKALEE